MKTLFTVLRSKGVAVTTAMLALTCQAQAALPAWASTAGADITERVDDTEAFVGPIIIGVIVAIVGIKLLKRFSNKI